ncbi:MAG: hypothetical protein IH587_07145 [Anaerolineae bacterium]|nr:hypothetical protein [Anaerolineae bacterium]
MSTDAFPRCLQTPEDIDLLQLRTQPPESGEDPRDIAAQHEFALAERNAFMKDDADSADQAQPVFAQV